MSTGTTATHASPRLGLADRLGGLRDSAARNYGVIIAFAVLFVTLSIASDAFLTTTNLLNVLDQWAPVGIMACGMTLVLIAGGFDLSVGAVYAVAGIVAAKLATSWGVAPGLLCGALVGLGFGLVNGVVVTLGRINPFIATLATGFIFRGFALVLSGGFLITVDAEGFDTLARSELLGVKYSIWIFVLTVLSIGFVLHRTVLGRYIYAVGGNEEAARLSGVRVSLVRALTYLVSGLTASLAGVIVTSRVATGQADAGTGIELEVIAAVVIGGISILGGEGAIWRAVIGVLMVAMIGNGFNLLNVQAEYQSMIFGALIMGAVGLDAWARRSGR